MRILVLVFLVLFQITIDSKIVLADNQNYYVKAGESLQDVINQTVDGDTIYVGSGAYQGPLVIKKEVAIIGDNSIIFYDKNENGIIIEENGITLSGITLCGIGRDVAEGYSAIRINSNNNVVKNCTIMNSYFGIYLDHANNNEILDNTIHDAGDANYLYYSNNNVIAGNNIRDSRYAVHIMDNSSDNLIQNNNLEHNITGVMTMLASNTKIDGNQIRNQYDYHGVGIIVYQSENTEIKNNIISQNTYGLQLEDCKDTEVCYNDIRLNAIGFVIQKNAMENKIYNNNIMGNVRHLISEENNIEFFNIDIGNYWDTYDGLDLSGAGIGNTEYRIGSSYFENIIHLREELQVFFNGPGMALLESIKTDEDQYNAIDKYPLVKPVQLESEQSSEMPEGVTYSILVLCSVMVLSIWIGIIGRKRYEKN